MAFEQEEVDQEKQTRRTQRWKERLSKTSAIHQLLNPTTTTTTAMNGTHTATSTPTSTSSPTSASSSVTITEDNDNKDKENILSQPTISTNSKPSIYLQQQQQQQHNGNSSAITTSTTILPDSIKNKEFHNNFKNIPIEDTLLQEFKCALQKDVLLQGKLYITKNNICFKSNIFGYVTCVEISVKDIKSIERVRVIKLMPRVIQIIMKNDEKYVFTSFLTSISARDEAYNKLLEVWQLMNPELNIVKSSSNQLSHKNNHSSSPPISHPSSIINTTTNAATNATIPAEQDNNQEKSHYRKRAHTLTDYNHLFNLIPIHRSRSLSSSAAHSKPQNNHVSWKDQPQKILNPSNLRLNNKNDKPIPEDRDEENDDDSYEEEDNGLEQENNALEQETKSKRINHHQHEQHKNKINRLSIMIFIGSVLLCISHLILSYRFYHVTHHLKNQIDSYQVAQSDETKWMASQLKDVRDQAQVWMKESMRQRQQLLDLMQ